MGLRNEEEVTININPKSVFPFLKAARSREVERSGGNEAIITIIQQYNN